ncbi:MAG: response regulator transcription factor [Desulfobacterales bacterium]|nr:response regulator transcription factor [Desulfobacterales bacterium]
METNTDKKRILIVEDEFHIAEGIKLNLSLKGYDVQIIDNGIEALQKWQAWKPHLIILDIMLPGMDGISVLNSIRIEDERLPIMILSAKGDPDDKINGLSCGVDDYITKPFNLKEFLLRVDRLMTRDEWQRDGNKTIGKNSISTMLNYQFGNNYINFETGLTSCKCGEVQLTVQEIKLLKLFIANKGKPLSRSQLLEIVWGYVSQAETRTVDNFIVRLRKYFEENPKKPVYFKSIRSVGYVFNP